MRSLPDGTLLSAKALPFRERFAIAPFACIPSRVERLITLVFTKLAERWNALEEQIREIDRNKSIAESGALDLRGVRSEKAARAKEKFRRERLLRAFKDRTADLQDELFLLDDVFRVRPSAKSSYLSSTTSELTTLSSSRRFGLPF